ncbi:MAG: endo-alpha-N-acetylgalactosaminidase family protein, partial [Sarcina sp.]
GLHINVTEYHLDAFQIKVENLVPGFIKAWNWIDQGYIVDKKKDFLSGEIKKKIDNLAKELPGLKWIYVDVYDGEKWVAYKLAKLLNSKGWMIGTEYSGPFEEQIGWVHWGSDPISGNYANTSKMVRFIRNGEQDVYVADYLLRGSKHIFPSGWSEKYDLEGPHVIEMFYNQNLPSKYMQHFNILEWNDNATSGFIRFDNGLITKIENGNINMYQDSKLIATTPSSSLNDRNIGITTLFIPWTWAQIDGKPQRKVYHWNPNGGQTTWDTPNMWSGVTKVKVYKLSVSGRTYVTDINVVNGKITINADAKTPYVLFPSDEFVSVSRINTWGEGSLIADPSFDSENITDNWTIQTTATNSNHVSRVKETFEGRLGNYVVMVSGNGGANAIISQKINGLSSGKTYTASVWVKLEGDRKVILGVNCNNVISETTINKKTTRVHRTGKWRGDTFTRMRIDFKVPVGITTATLYFNVASDSKDSKVYLDEFRL